MLDELVSTRFVTGLFSLTGVSIGVSKTSHWRAILAKVSPRMTFPRGF